MKSKPTNTVNILGLTYTVELVPYILRDEYRIGQLDPERQEIKILDSLSGELAAQTLLHEIIHGILKQLKRFDEDNDERLVQGLALGMYDCLKDDPSIIFNLINKRRQSMNKKQTSPKVASKASKILSNDHAGKNTKSVAGSALSQTRTPGKPKK
jgi:hypothetical protein